MAKEKRFYRGEAIRFGWEVLKKNLLFFVLVLLLTWAVEALFSSPNMAAGRSLFVAPLFSLISFVIGIIVGMAYIRISLRFAGGEKADFSDLWAGYPLFFKYLVGAILYALIVLAGLILLIIPGIIWAIKYQFYGYFVIDQEMPPVAALRKSGQITKGSKWNLFVLGLAFIGIMLLGALACGVGLFAAIPTVMVAHAWVYRKLASQFPDTGVAPPQPIPEQALPQAPGTPPVPPAR